MNDQSAPAAPAAPPPLVSGCAIASFVLAIIGLILCILGLLLTLVSIVLGGIFAALGAILCLLAVVLGIVGLIGRKRGKGMALAGLLIGALPILGPTLLAPNVMKVKTVRSDNTQSGSTRQTIAKIRSARDMYKIRTGRELESVRDLVNAGLLDPKNLKDEWGNEFWLIWDDSGGLEICSTGPDGELGTPDDIVN